MFTDGAPTLGGRRPISGRQPLRTGDHAHVAPTNTHGLVPVIVSAGGMEPAMGGTPKRGETGVEGQSPSSVRFAAVPRSVAYRSAAHPALCRALPPPVGRAAVVDPKNRDLSTLFVDPVEHAVGAPPG